MYKLIITQLIFKYLDKIKPKNNYYKGKKAEALAVNYLKANKYNIITLNFKTKVGEIDILASKNNILIAFEVKYRNNSHILPYSILKKQQHRINKAFQYFIKLNPKYNNYYLQINAILIDNNNNITLINNAW